MTTGGIYGIGHRMPIKVTRDLVTGALDGVGMFQKNFAKFESAVDAEVRAAAPEVRLAAE